jgi:hypothetical protein
MSYDLYFWREERPQSASPGDTCERLCSDEDVNGIAALSVDKIKLRFAQEFPGIEDNGTELTWEGAGSYFQVTWAICSKPGFTLCIIVNCGWQLLKAPETMNRIIDLGNGLGCALYDPQTGTRYPQPKEEAE